MTAHLLVYRFGTDAAFEGHLVGALERVEINDSEQVLDILFIARDSGGELFAVEAHGRRAGGMVASLLGFRLDVQERRRLTRRALRGARADLIAVVQPAVLPGDGLAAILVGSAFAGAFEDAVARTGGRTLVSTGVAADSLSELAPAIAAAAADHRGA